MRAVLGVVIAGADMDVAAQAVVILADDEDHLAVGLEPDHAVGDMDTGLLHRSARRILVASSKRALSSTTTATCLPFWAAWIRESMIRLWRRCGRGSS